MLISNRVDKDNPEINGLPDNSGGRDMSNIKIIGTRTDTGFCGGMACGPMGMDVACTEMHIQEDGVDKYLSMCYVPEGMRMLETYVTPHPIYELLLAEDITDEDMEELDKLRSEGEMVDECDPNSPYHEQFAAMAKNLLAAMKKADMFDENIFDCEEEVWPWLVELAGMKFDFDDEDAD